MNMRIDILAGLALNSEQGRVPDWVQLTPAGPLVQGRDGRRWWISDPDALVAAFNASAKRPQIDIEHSSQIKAPKGEAAPAVGWIEELALRDGAVWGRVDWTADGANAVGSRAYRYLSPAFTFDAHSREVHRIVSAGLTNNPNLDLAALNAAGGDIRRANRLQTPTRTAWEQACGGRCQRTGQAVRNCQA